MLGRLSFSGRIMAIVLLALLGVQALSTGIGYVARKRETAGDPLKLLPERAVAIVELIETSPPDRREAIVKAVSSEDLSARVSAEPLPIEPGAERQPAVEWVVGQYFPAGETREIAAYLKPEGGSRWAELRLGKLWLASREPLRISIGLKPAGFVMLETRGDIAPRLWGMPPGFVIGLVGALVGILALIAVWRESRPLRALSAAVATFTGEAAPVPVSEDGAPEIRKLIGAMNAMQARIAALVMGRTVLLGAVSHDLKTYLTRLRLRAELVEDEEERQKTVRDLEDMTRLVDDALAVARGSAVSDLREPVDMAGLISAEAGEHPGRDVTVEGCDASLLLTADPIALRRLFSNLVGNALRYGQSCRIRCREDGHWLSVFVDDDGPGIPVSEREAVFEPFHRLETSRNRATGGSGLGLAIARQIATGHGGSITVSSSPEGGARFEIRLPAPEAR